ncbi:MAG: hypothetical protein AVDCRST_MAG77-3310, partial [uncultured Chloroflexi bacterium]
GVAAARRRARRKGAAERLRRVLAGVAGAVHPAHQSLRHTGGGSGPAPPALPCDGGVPQRQRARL